MATSNLRKLGRSLGRTSKDVGAATTSIQEHFPVVESSTDIITPFNRIVFDFYTYTQSPSVYLDIVIYDKIKYGNMMVIQ